MLEMIWENSSKVLVVSEMKIKTTMRDHYMPKQARSRALHVQSPQGFRLITCLFFFLAAPRSTWDLSSPARIKPTPSAVEVQNLNHWNSQTNYLYF